jgi:hypothetical protein
MSRSCRRTIEADLGRNQDRPRRHAEVSSPAPQIVVVSGGSSGGWSRATFGTVADCHTRPSLMLDSTNGLVHVYATAPDSRCPFSGAAGTIFEKTSPMNNLSFPSGRRTPVMRTAASPNLNNVTGSKQTVDAATGILILASNEVTKQYWASDESLETVPSKPTASFTASPTSGTAPLAVTELSLRLERADGPVGSATFRRHACGTSCPRRAPPGDRSSGAPSPKGPVLRLHTDQLGTPADSLAWSRGRA